jgi:hypothetical protein
MGMSSQSRRPYLSMTNPFSFFLLYRGPSVLHSR